MCPAADPYERNDSTSEDLTCTFEGALERLGKDFIKHYHEALQEGKLPIARINIDLIGEGSAGKSSFADSLIDELYKQYNASTIGTHIRIVIIRNGKWEEPKGNDRVAGLNEILAAGYVDRRRQKQSEKFGASNDENKSAASDEVSTADEFKLVTDEQAALIEYLEKNEEKLRECRGLIYVTLRDRGGQEVFLTSHAALMPDCNTHSSTAYMYVTNLNKPLSSLATNTFRGTAGNVQLKRYRVQSGEDFVQQWVSAVDLAHPEAIYRLVNGQKLRNPPMFFIGTHRDEIEKNPEGRELVARQELAIATIVQKRSNYNERIVFTEGNKVLFEVDNTLSGSGNPDAVVVHLKSIVSDMAEKYATDEQTPDTPLSWVAVEIGVLDVAGRENFAGKMVDINELFTMAQGYCSTLDRFQSALKYLSSYGVIVCWFEVTGLKDTIFTDPQWLFDVMSTYVTVLDSSNVPGRFWHALEKLKTEGVMSRTLAEYLLEVRKLGVKPEHYNKIFHVLQLVDIFCPAVNSPERLAIEDVTEFYVPCMLEDDFKQATAWVESGYDNAVGQNSGCLPPSLIIKPDNVDCFPEPLFFRMSARTAYEFSNNPMLTRDCVQVHLPDDLELELLYHRSNKYVIATVYPTVRSQTPAVDVMNKQCVWVRRFLCWQLNDAKRRGMNGLEYKLNFQFEKKHGEMRVDERSLYEIPIGDRMWETVSNQWSRLTKADCQQVMPWYYTETLANDVNDETSLPLRQIAEFVGDRWTRLASTLEPRPFYRNEWIRFDNDCFAMLRAWKDEHKDQATAERLKQSLVDSELRHVAEKFLGPTSSAGKVTADQFIKVVRDLGHNQWYGFGSGLFSKAKIDSLTDAIPDYANKLQALTDGARRQLGEKATVEKLWELCDNHEILGGVKDELDIKEVAEIIVEDSKHKYSPHRPEVTEGTPENGRTDQEATDREGKSKEVTDGSDSSSPVVPGTLGADGGKNEFEDSAESAVTNICNGHSSLLPAVEEAQIMESTSVEGQPPPDHEFKRQPDSDRAVYTGQSAPGSDPTNNNVSDRKVHGCHVDECCRIEKVLDPGEVGLTSIMYAAFGKRLARHKWMVLLDVINCAKCNYHLIIETMKKNKFISLHPPATGILYCSGEIAVKFECNDRWKLSLGNEQWQVRAESIVCQTHQVIVEDVSVSSKFLSITVNASCTRNGKPMESLLSTTMTICHPLEEWSETSSSPKRDHFHALVVCSQEFELQAAQRVFEKETSSKFVRAYSDLPFNLRLCRDWMSMPSTSVALVAQPSTGGIECMNLLSQLSRHFSADLIAMTGTCTGEEDKYQHVEHGSVVVAQRTTTVSRSKNERGRHQAQEQREEVDKSLVPHLAQLVEDEVEDWTKYVPEEALRPSPRYVRDLILYEVKESGPNGIAKVQLLDKLEERHLSGMTRMTFDEVISNLMPKVDPWLRFSGQLGCTLFLTDKATKYIATAAGFLRQNQFGVIFDSIGTIAHDSDILDTGMATLKELMTDWKLKCIDREAHYFMEQAYKCFSPGLPIVIKGISDYGTDTSKLRYYQRMAASTPAAFLKHFIIQHNLLKAQSGDHQVLEPESQPTDDGLIPDSKTTGRQRDQSASNDGKHFEQLDKT